MLTEKQLLARKQGIGASEAAIVMGASSWCTPYKLWMIKTGKIEADDLSQRPDIWWGNELESIIAKRYQIVTGSRLKRNNRTLRHKAYPHILCHIDRKVIGQHKIVEIKSTNFFSYEWGDPGTDRVPESYYWQVQQQLAITGCDIADIAVYPKGSDDIRIYNVPRNNDLIMVLIERVNEFWRCVVSNTEPPIVTRDDAALAYPNPNGLLKQAPDEVFEAIERLKVVKQGIKEEEKKKDELEAIVVREIADADGLYFSEETKNKPIVTWKKNKNGSRVLRIM